MVVIETPFVLGQEMWEALGTPRQVTVPCPVCFGKYRVTVIMGDGEHVSVPCEGCGNGYNGPQGTITEYVHEPSVRRFVIGAVKSMHGDNWIVSPDDDPNHSIAFDNLFATEAEALAAARARTEAQQESNMRTRSGRRGDAKRLSWTVRYHRKCIADLERQLAWHRGKLESPPATDAVDPHVSK